MNRKIAFRAWDKIKKVMQDVEGWELGTVLSEGTEYEAMQFTGITDKNGKECYEGDLMLTDDVYHDYEGGVAINALPDGKIVQIEFRDGAFFAGDELLFEYANAWEIIGNVWESPELLDPTTT